jgi:hypothetical protein
LSLAVIAAGVLHLPASQRQVLLPALPSLLLWLPVPYGVVALSHAGHHWRWRLLLGRLGIDHTGWADLLGWLRGLAVSATPAKLGELGRAQLLHEQLGYPRVPLVHMFVAERCSDLAALGVLLLLLTPAQVLGRLPALSSSLLPGLALDSLATVPAALISVLVGANEAMVLWLLVQWLAAAAGVLPLAAWSPLRRGSSA